MTDPINYTSAFSDLPNPGQSIIEGLKTGVGIQQLQMQQAQQQKQAQVIRSLISNPNAGAADYAQAMLLVPGMKDQLKQSWDTLNTNQQQNMLSDLSQYSAALQNDRPDVATQLIRNRADAMENTAGGPTPQSKALRTQADVIDAHPSFGKYLINSMLVAHPDGGKVIDAIAKLGQEQRSAEEAPAKARKANAEADTAEADAALKKFGIIGQTLGSLQGRNVKPEQVQTALKSLVAKKVISSDELPGYLAAVPSDPTQLNDWLGSMKLAGMKPEEQMKYTTPDANTVANNKTQLAVQDKIDARQERAADLNVTHGIKGLTLEQNDALFGENGAVTTGRLDPNRINSRTAAIYADAFLKNPNADFAKISSDIALGRNATFRQRAMTAETLPEVMQNMVDAGKKVGFSDNRFVGKAQMFLKGATNDPDLTAYMTTRNDALMTIAQVMRGAGMTDMAHRAEEEAAAPTMSPPALEAWMRSQMAALKPRLEQNRRITRDEPHAPAAPTGPAVGAIEQGYRFKGGDPSKAKNWEKL